MDANKEQSVNLDNSQIVVLSSDDENDSQNSQDNLSNEKGSSSVISVDDDDDNANNDESAESDCEILGIEDLQGEEKWRDIHGPFKRLNSLIQAGFNDPRLLLVRVFGMDEDSLPSDPNQLLSLLLTLLAEPAPRRRLRHINTLEKVVSLMSTCTSILVITGAGISVSCGIPDFRSRDGIYARLSRDFPDLSSPQAMFDMSYFKRNPIPFFKFAKELFPGQFSPSITHRMIALLESKDKLLRNYTQNIDTLEQAAGITRLIQCHGSFASATCTTCKHKVSSDVIKEAIFAQSIPRCTNCWPAKFDSSIQDEVNDSESTTHSSDLSTVEENLNTNNNNMSIDTPPKVKSKRNNKSRRKRASYGVLKPDIVFFGEGLSSEFHDSLSNDVKRTDLVLVIGSSLKVRPVAHIPNAVPRQVPQILINREPLSNHDFDVELLGDCDVIISELCHRLGWEVSGLSNYTPLTEIPLNSLKSTTESLKQSQKSPDVPQLTAQDIVSSELANNVSQTNNNDTQPTKNAFTPTVVSTSGSSLEMIDMNSSNDDAVIEVSEDDEDEECVWEVASSLPPGTFTRIYPNQYVFPGAEIYLEDKPGEITISCNSSDVCSTTSNPSSSSSYHEDESVKIKDSHKNSTISIDITEKEESSIHSTDSRKSLKRHNSSENHSLNESSLKQPRSI
ncbi:hypothetical protein MN116_002293 [Schistosoma mekongi]|uniref:protein acetyllysine N-acetyltransferase n=1 Tax=Schistosoma mekongi TaxID=38744 RepID=A0AAE1ZJW5_SCHME|nr:hypothetical protein MN116_002293 [Schistosoma mekongi]